MKEAVKRLLEYTLQIRQSKLHYYEQELKELLGEKDELIERERLLRRAIQETREEIEAVEELKNLGNKDNDGDNKR